MIRWLKLGGVLAGASLVLSACGKASGGEVSNDSAGSVSQQAFALSYAQVLGQNLASCCDSQQLDYDSESCESTTQKKLQALLDSLVTSNTVYDAHAAGDCLNQLKTTAICGDFEHASNEGACLQVIAGKLDDGEPCKVDSECKSMCIFNSDGKSGTCGEPADPVAIVKKGERCNVTCRSAETCAEGGIITAVDGDLSLEGFVGCDASKGLHCGEGTCQPQAAAGEVCGDSADCGGGMACHSGKCGPTFANGSSCSANEQCESRFCQDGTCADGVSAAECATDGPLRGLSVQ